jgi:hypothetical protein
VAAALCAALTLLSVHVLPASREVAITIGAEEPMNFA